MSISGRCSSSVMRMTLALSFTGSNGFASAAGFSSGLRTRYLTIFLSIFMDFISVRLAGGGLVLAVVAFFQRVIEIGGGVFLAVVFDLFVAGHFDLAAILEREHVLGVLEVFFLHEHALEGFGVEPERGAALQALLVGIGIDVLEVFVLVVGGHVGRLRDGGIHPQLRGG